MLPDEKYRNDKKQSYLSSDRKIEYVKIGKSILSKDIDGYKIGSGKRLILVVGAHHALEYITSQALYDFIDFITDKSTRPRTLYGISLDFLLNRFAFFIVPMLNVDGVEMHFHGASDSPLRERVIRLNGGGDFSTWQSNARGVDLNHNYDFGFLQYKQIEYENGILAGKTRYSGEYVESEPECRALANLTRIVAPSAIISLHSQGKEIFYSPKNEYTERIAKRLAKELAYTVKIPEGLASYGGFCDYTGGVLGIPSFTLEVGEGKNPLPERQLKSVSETVRRALITLPSYL